jgi:hypothetical protein
MLMTAALNGQRLGKNTRFTTYTFAMKNGAFLSGHNFNRNADKSLLDA